MNDETLSIRVLTIPAFDDELRCYFPVKRTWKLIEALYERLGDQPIVCEGIKDFMRKAAKIVDPTFQSPGITSYSVRRGLRELVDHGFISCDPNPSQGERLPD